MKKILCFMLIIVVIASVTVPAFATYNLPDWEENWSDYKIYIYEPAEDAYYVYMFDKNYYDRLYYDTTSNVIKRSSGGNILYYYSKLVDGNWRAISSSNQFYDFSTLGGTIVRATFTLYDQNGDIYFEPICDGSTCPLSDVNFDDICDTCGMSVAYNLRVTPKTYEFIIKHSDDLTLKYIYTETLAGTEMNAVYADDRVTVSFNNPVIHYQYKLVGDEWEEYASYPNTYGSHAMSLSDTAIILSSNLVVYDENGEVFFRNPLWMVMGQVTQGEMENLTAETGGTMKVLALCGVGLIALLLVLRIFGKRSLIFLK